MFQANFSDWWLRYLLSYSLGLPDDKDNIGSGAIMQQAISQTNVDPVLRHHNT